MMHNRQEMHQQGAETVLMHSAHGVRQTGDFSPLGLDCVLFLFYLATLVFRLAWVKTVFRRLE